MTIPTNAKRPGGNQGVRNKSMKAGKHFTGPFYPTAPAAATMVAVMDGRTFVGWRWFASADEARRHMLHGGLL